LKLFVVNLSIKIRKVGEENINDDMEKTQTKVVKAGYGKRPLWQWLVIYVVVGGIIYGLVYYLIFARKGTSIYGMGSASGSTQGQQSGSSSGIY